MTTRVLPPSEWDRLAHTEFRHLPWMHDEELTVVVVERAGEIVASWGLMPMWHLEGLWIDPSYRGKPSVARRLMRAIAGVIKDTHARWVMTGADTDAVRRMLIRVGAKAVPMDTFVIPSEAICHWQH
jgi:hypothetical protein